jgi:L-lactate dehydrogenase complex protein LldG
MPAEERIASFCAALEKLAGKAYVTSSRTETADCVREIVNKRRTIATRADVLRDCGIVYPECAVADAEVGITSADFALADTGTLVSLAISEPRLFSLLPPAHIAVVPRERILTGLDELLTVLPRPAEQSASMVLITGPSRTADIEQILVRGVHGPGELHVVVI